ncbi:MAG TPA: FAD-dependent oxidoreductase, partial [Candidatus Gracilibacteria bacterium]
MAKKVAIIGAGVAGIMTAYVLNEKGYQVSLYAKG